MSAAVSRKRKAARKLRKAEGAGADQEEIDELECCDAARRVVAHARSLMPSDVGPTAYDVSQVVFELAMTVIMWAQGVTDEAAHAVAERCAPEHSKSKSHFAQKRASVSCTFRVLSPVRKFRIGLQVHILLYSCWRHFFFLT